MFNSKKIIFDVGAYDGADGLMLALKNPYYLIYAFEANPEQYKIINNNKNILENRIGKKIKNYQVFNFAISNIKKNVFFYISKNPTVSSLNNYRKNVFKSWPGFQEHFSIKNKIKIKTVTLEDFCKKNNIENISYLHCDSQGNDLNVLKGMGRYISKLTGGNIESAVKKNRSIYRNNHTLKQVKDYLYKNHFKITKIESIHGTMGNEVNVFFKKKSILFNNDINLNYNCRYLQRVFSSKTYFKDNIRDFFLRLYNKFLYRT